MSTLRHLAHELHHWWLIPPAVLVIIRTVFSLVDENNGWVKMVIWTGVFAIAFGLLVCAL